MPVFSCDSGLYFDNIEETLQPGTHVRRVNGRELSDEEMIDYYANLAAQNKNQLIGRYLNAIYLMIDRETYYYSMDETLATKPFMLVSKAHKKRVAGFPLDSLSVDISSGKYYYDMAEKIVDTSGMEQEFFNFFQNVVTKSK
jgi:8-oxo-dGTP diphosphatase